MPFCPDFLDDHRGEGQQAQQEEGDQDPGGEDVPEGIDPAQLTAGVGVDQGAGDDTQRGGPDIGQGGHPGEAAEEVDPHEGEDRGQAQGQQVIVAVAIHFPVESHQVILKFILHPLAQQVAGQQEGDGGPDGGPDVDKDGGRQGAEYKAAAQSQDGGPGQRQAGDPDVDQDEDEHRQQETVGHVPLDIGFVGL